MILFNAATTKEYKFVVDRVNLPVDRVRLNGDPALCGTGQYPANLDTAVSATPA